MANDYKSQYTGAQLDNAINRANNPDTSPTSGSSNLVTSGGVKAALETLNGDIDEMSEDVQNSIAALSKEINIIKHGYVDDTSDDEDSEEDETLNWDITNNGNVLNGSTVGSGLTNGTADNFGCVKISVKAKQVFVISAYGGTNARAFSMLDASGKILAVAGSGANVTNTILTASEDGYIAVNNNFSKKTSPYVRRIEWYKQSKTTTISNNSAYFTTSTVGNTVGNSTTNNNYRCLMLPVCAGTKATIYTYGGSNGRAWALTNTSKKILSNSAANANFLIVPASVVINNNGYLFINCDNSQIGDDFVPYVTIDSIESGDSESEDLERELCLDTLNERLSALENDGGSQSSASDKKLKVLCVGNSFTENMTDYLSSFLTGIGNRANVTVYRICYGSSSLSNWLSWLDSGTTRTSKKIYGETMTMGNTFASALANDWDVIVFQQLSSSSATYSTYEPYLHRLIAKAKMICTNPSVKIAWHLTWPRISSWTSSGPKGTEGFASIVTATKSMLAYYNGIIDFIIPSGTAIMNARGNSTLSNDGELSSDGQHLAQGVGMYLATCCFYQAILSNIVGKHLSSSTFTTSKAADTGITNVTADNRSLCHSAVMYAITDNWNINTIE